MLIDRCTIFVRSGKGGDGCVSLRREKYVPKGGPDGGDGGRGGDVILVGDRSETTLLAISSRPHRRATGGQQGGGNSRFGAAGVDQVVKVPLGTLVYDQETGDLLTDITDDGERYVAAPGGKGGFGNEHFKSAINQTPREATPGEPAVNRTLRLELKLIADFGLVGKPNAGKSTMLRAISKATPKVAAYPFTTLSPNLGMVELPGERRMVFADIPGLIEGAADGAGLGHDFLRHIERTKVLVHLLDVVPLDGSDPVDHYRAIRGELAVYSDLLVGRPEIVVLNKVDLLGREVRDPAIAQLRGRLELDPDHTLIVASGATGEGTREMLEACWTALDHAPASSWGE